MPPIAVDIEGSGKQGEILWQLLSYQMPGWKGVGSTRKTMVKNGSRLEVTSLPPGFYQFCRYRMLHAGEVGHGMMLDVQFVELRAGETTRLDFVRPAGARIDGALRWDKSQPLESIILSIRSIDKTKDPNSSHEFQTVLDARLVGELQDGATGRPEIDYSSGAAEFRTERIPPGRYELQVDAYAPLTDAQRASSGIIGPTLKATKQIVVPETGGVPSVSLELSP